LATVVEHFIFIWLYYKLLHSVGLIQTPELREVGKNLPGKNFIEEMCQESLENER
jgi:hypothetical protein